MTVSVWWKRIAVCCVAVLIGWVAYVEVWGRIEAGLWANIYITRCIQVNLCPPVDKLFGPPAAPMAPVETKGK